MTTNQMGLSGKFLVVDDSAFDRARLVAVVKSMGCAAIEVAYADQVLDVARKEQPMMILMDVVMGPPNGFELCRILREHPETKHIPVILCSVKSTKVDHDWARRQGAMGYLAKPIDHEKTKDFLQKQWTRFQEALLLSKQRSERRLERQKRVADAVNGAVSTQQQLQERLKEMHPALSSKLAPGQGLEATSSTAVGAPIQNTGVSAVEHDEIANKQEGNGSSQ